MFTEQQIIALSESIEHWYEICTTVYTNDWEMPIGAKNCACCKVFMYVEEDYSCNGCPIAGYVNTDCCDKTPYGNCYDAAINFNKDPEAFYEAAIEEYQFLIEVMCSKDPWENCDD